VLAAREEPLRNLIHASVTLLTVLFPLAAQTTVTGTQTLTSGQHLNLDDGTTGLAGGDLYWTSTPQLGSFGSAVIAFPPGSVTASNFASITQAQLIGYTYNSTQVFGAKAGTVFAVYTNQNNYSAVLITAVAADQTSVTLQFITFHSPTISKVVNNYSQIDSGFPNSGIAVGSLFIIKGGSLASATTVSALQSSLPPGLPSTLNGASVSVTVNGATVTPVFYYAISTQLALVLPSSTPLGAGTITATFNGQTSQAFNIQVVASALGFAGYYGYGSGLGIATNPFTGALYSYTNSIPPGTTVVLWGSGLGADSARDVTFVTPVGGFAINSLAALYVGNIPATIGYQGASGYPGVNQLNVTIPANAPTGCHVPVVGVTAAGVPTNFITLPIGAGVCQEPEWGRDGTALSSLATQATVNAGYIELNEPLDASGNVPSSPGTYMPVGFFSYTGAGFASATGVVSSGGCIANSTIYSSTISGLVPGPIFPSGINLEIIPTQPPNTFVLPPGTVGPGGSETFQVQGSNQVGGFTVTASLPSPVLNWTNQNAAATITKSKGLLVTWTGGQAGTYVSITGTPGGPGAAGSFTCIAPLSAGQFTVPPYVFAALSGQTADITVQEQTVPQTFTAAHIDYAFTQGADSQKVSAALQ